MDSGVKTQQLIFVYPGDLATPTGGYAYDRRIIHGLTQLGWQVELLSLGDGFPYPSQEVITSARQLLLHLKPGIPIVMDGLALGVLPEIVAELSLSHCVIALIHHPLAFEIGISTDQAAAFKASEALALSCVKQVVVNSPTTAKQVSQFLGVQSGNIEVILPGTDRQAIKNRSEEVFKQSDGRLHLLSVGSVIHRKGFDVLLEALYPLIALPWMLSIAGDITRDPFAYQQLEKNIVRFGLQDRVHVLGAVTEEHLENLYCQADVFVLASRFEGYGMAYAEAIARGIPVIGTNAGAIADTVPANAGLLVPPDDVRSLTIALQRMIQDEECRLALSQGASEVAALQTTWEDSSKRFSEVLSRFVGC